MLLKEEVDVSHADTNKAIDADSCLVKKAAMDEENSQTPHRRMILSFSRDKFAPKHGVHL